MKTALQELKDKFMEAGTLADWMDDAFDEAIEKEKQQIIYAYDKGSTDWCNYDPERHGNQHPLGKDYYNQTFNK